MTRLRELHPVKKNMRWDGIYWTDAVPALSCLIRNCVSCKIKKFLRMRIPFY